jgi:hypothetical protein
MKVLWTVPCSRHYEYGQIGMTPVYVASHFREKDAALLDRCLETIANTREKLVADVW